MQEALFSNSPTDLILSIVGFILVVAFPFTISQKTKVRQLPRALQQFVATLLIWNFAHIIGDAVIGTANSPAAYILFGIQAMAWIQAGDSTRHVAEISFVARRTPLWRIKHIVAEICVIATTVMFCINQEWMVQTFGIPFLGLEQHPAFVVYGAMFFIFVVPDLSLTFYTMLKRSLHMSDQTLVQINVYMLTTFGFFVLFPLTLDFIIPLAYNFQNSPEPVTFLQWFQYSAIFIAILCGQYFTSVSFKNKSAWWFLNGFVRYMGDCVVYFDSKGHILFANPASQQIFQLSDSDIATVNVQQLLPDIDTQHEATYTNVKVKIKNELHTFNVGIFKLKQSLTTSVNVLLLSDQTNLLFYQQRIKTLNRQFTEYKQDLIRYQERLDISEKRSKETENINATLINALPFQFWSKNENGVYLTQNIKDVTMRGNLNKTTDAPDSIKVEEIEAREDGRSKIFTTFEDADHNEISEEEASINIKNDKQIYVYQNHFIPIIVNRPPYKVIGLKIDMSEEKRLERERNMLREQKIIHSRLEDLGTACGAFAHDYNNLLGSQIGFCQLAQELLNSVTPTIPDEKVQKSLAKASSFVSEATTAAQRGKQSLNVLLDTVRGKTESKIPSTVFPPATIVRSVIDKVILTLPPNIQVVSGKMNETAEIKAQVPSLERILSNLANNAIYAMKDKGGTLSFDVQLETLDHQLLTPYAPPIPPGSYVKISVADTGTGIDSGTLERIFAPFFTTKAPGEGLGLGLSSAVRLLKEGNAYFTIQTTVGEGTTFNLYWDLYEEEK
jgi:signal transduction histidine kinase